MAEWQVNSGDNLQNAINNAAAGDTIIVAAGDYSSEGTITINKSITIKAAKPAATAADAEKSIIDNIVISNPADPANLLTVEIDGLQINSKTSNDVNGWAHGIFLGTLKTESVTVKNCNIDITGGTKGSNGIKMSLGEDDKTENIIIEDNIITGSAENTESLILIGDKASLKSLSVTGNTLSGCSSHGMGFDFTAPKDYDIIIDNNNVSDCGRDGIKLAGLQDVDSTVTINNNAITNVNNAKCDADDGAIAIRGAGEPKKVTIKEVTITNNTVSNAQVGVFFESPENTAITVSGNSIAIVEKHAPGVGETPAASGISGYDIPEENTTNTIQKLEKFTSIVVDNSLTDAEAGDIVTVGGKNYIMGKNAFASINAAVEAAADGATITLTAGEYSEFVKLDLALLRSKSVSFVGETDAEGKSQVTLTGGLEVGDDLKDLTSAFNSFETDWSFSNIKFKANPGETDNYARTNKGKKVQINNAGSSNGGSLTFDKCSFYAVDKDGNSGEYIDNAYILVQYQAAHHNGYFCNVKYNECDFTNGRVSFYMGNSGNEFNGCIFNDAPINDMTGNYIFNDCEFNADLSKIVDGSDYYVLRSNQNSASNSGKLLNGAVFNITNSGNVDFTESATDNIIWIRSNADATKATEIANVTFKGLDADNMAGINPFGNTVYTGDKTAPWLGEEEKIFVKGLLVDGFESEDDIKALLARTSGVLHAVVGNKYYIYNDGEFASATDISTIFVDSAFAEEGVPEGKVFGVNAFTDINAANDMAVNAVNAKIVIAENAVYTTGVFDNIADNSDAYWGPVSPANNVTTVQIDGSVAASTAAVINNKKATVSSTGSLKGVEHVTVTGENGELLVAGEVTTNNLRTVLGASMTVSGKAFLNGVTVGDTYWGTSDKKSVITFDGAEVEYSGRGGGDSDPLQFDVIDGNELNIINKSTVKSSAARYKLTINVGKDADFNVESGSSVTAENIINNGKVKVDGATLNLAGTVTNNKEMFVSGASTINGGYDENGDAEVAEFTGDGWVYMKSAKLDADTNIKGANIRFVEGESVIDGATINPTGNYFQVGAGHYITNLDNPNKEAELDRENDVTVIVKNNAYIDGGSAEGYGTWVGTEYYENNNDAKVANMTEARYTLDIQNSLAVFDTIHVSNDGILKVTGRSERVIENEHTVWNGVQQNVNFYTGTVANYNGLVILDNTNAWSVSGVNISGDNTSTGDAAGRLIIQNKAVYRFHQDGDSNDTSLNIKNYGSVTVNNSVLEMEDGTISIAADAVLNVENSANVYAAKGVKNDGMIEVDGNSLITAKSITGDGSIEIDATGFSGVRKVVDVEAEGMGISDITVINNNNAAKFVQNDEGDIILVNVDGSNVVVNAAWTSQEDVDAALNNPSEITGVYFGGNAFNNLADAAAAVSENGTIALMQGQDENGEDLSISAAAQVVKDMTITGNARFDWSKGQLYVGRGTGAKDAKLTIKDAVILSASNQAATGFHISNAEIGATDTKANGTLIIRNSQVEVDYMINKNKVEVIGDGDHTKYDLFVKNGFDVAGRKASETVDGNVHEAVLEIDGGYVRIDNENGMGLGRAGEGAGKLYIYNNGKFEALQDFHVDTEEGKIVVEDSTLIVKGKLSEYSGAAAGKVTVSSSEGKSSTLDIANMVGTIVADGDTTLKDSTIGATGKVEVEPAYQYALSVNGKDTGTLTFEGENKIASIDAGKGDKVIVGKDATLEITLDDGMKIGNGAEWNITGNLAEGAAKSEETAAAIANSEITASLKSGWYFLSLDGSDADSVTTMTVSNAYVKGGHFSGKSKNVNNEYFDGTFNVTYTNSYIEQDGRFELQRKSSDDAAKDTDPQVNITYKDSVVAGNLQYYVNYQENATVTFDNSTASYTTRFQNEGSLKVLNGAEVSFVNGTVADSDNNSQPAGHNTGLIEVNGGELTFTDKALVNAGTIEVIDGTFIGSVENSGTFTVSSTEGKSSTLDMELTAGTVTVAGGTSLSNTEIVGNGTTELSGTVNFYGDNVITTTGINTNKLIVNKGASLEITRFVLAYGRSVSVYGNIADATALDETTIKNEKVSFKTAGISINGGGTGDFYAENAYIDLTGGDTTIKSESTATGKYTYTFKNSYLRTKNFGNNRSTAGSWTVTFDDSNVYGTSDLGIGNNVEVKFTNGSVGYFDRCIEMRGGTLTVDATSKLTVNSIMNNKKGELNTENEDIYGTVNVYGELALNDGNNNQGIDFIDAEVNVKGGKFTSDAQLIVVGDSQFNIDSLGFIDVKSMTGDNISISVDAAKFAETKKLIDVDEASFDNATIEVINKAADSKADKLVFNNDLYITDQDKSTLYVNSAYADEEVGDIVDGKIIGYNAFDDIADAINALEGDKSVIEVSGTVKSNWLNQNGLEAFNNPTSKTIDYALNFQKAEDAESAIIDATLNRDWVSYAFTKDVTIGEGVTLQLFDCYDYMNQWDNCVNFAPDGDELTLTVDGTFIYSSGNFGAGSGINSNWQDTDDKTVNVVVSETGKMFATGSSNNTFYENSTLSVTGTGKDNLQFSAGSYTQFGGEVTFTDTYVRIWGDSILNYPEGVWMNLGNSTFAGSGKLTATNTRIDVVDGISYGDTNPDYTSTKNPTYADIDELHWNIVAFNKESELNNTDIYAGDMEIRSNTVAMNGGSINLFQNTYKTEDSSIKDSTGLLSIAQDATLTVDGSTEEYGAATIKAVKVENNGAFAASNAVITADTFKHYGTEATFNNVDLNVTKEFVNDSDGFAIVSGESKVQIAKLSGNKALRLAENTVLLNGTSISSDNSNKAWCVRAQGSVTFGKEATDVIYVEAFDNYETNKPYGYWVKNVDITVNGTLNVSEDGKSSAQLYILGGSIDDGFTTKLTGAGTVNVNTKACFELGQIVIDENLTINIAEVANTHLRFTDTNMTIKGSMTKKGYGDVQNRMTRATVNVTGEKGSLVIDDNFHIGYADYAYDFSITDAHKSTLNVESGAKFEVGGTVFVNTASVVSVTDAAFKAGTVNNNNNGTFEVSGEASVVVDEFYGNMTFGANAVLSNDSKIDFVGVNTVTLGGDFTFQHSDLTGVENWEGAGKININDVTLPGEGPGVILLSDSDNDVAASQLVINGSNVVDGKIVSNGKVYEVVNTDGEWTIKQYVAPTPEPGEDPVEPAYTPMSLIAGVKQSDEADESGNYTFTISAEAVGGKLLDGEKYDFTYSAYYEAEDGKKTIDVAADGTFKAPFSVGNVVVSVTVKDAFGDSTAVSSNIGYVVKDYVAPELNLDLNGYTSGSWSTESVTLTASASDVDNNDAAKVMFSADNGSSWAEFDGSVTLSDGEYDYWFKAVDGAGNESAIEKVSVKVDSSDPTMEISGNVAEWTNGDVTLFANVADSTSGIASVKYQIGDGEWTDYTDAGVLVEENADVKFEVIDNAGNKTENSVLVDKIDKVAPTLEISGNAEKWTNQPVELTAAYSDGTVEYFNGSEWVAGDKLTVTENGTYLFRVTDAAGNVAEQSVVVDKIDTDKADLTVVGNATEWTNKDVTLFAKVADSASGIASVKYQIGDGDWTDYTNAGVTVEENADVKFEVIDNAGNVTVEEVVVDKIDKAEAVLTITGNAEEWTNSDVTLFAGANEEDAVIEYLKNGEWVAYTNDGVTVEENSIVSFKVTDQAGNVTYKSEEVKFIDKVDPTMELTASTVEATNADVVLNAVVSDGTVEYFNGTDWVAGDKLTVSENGTYQFRVIDAAGNVTESSIEVTNIDKDAPTLTLAASTVEATNSDVELTATVSDGTVEYYNGSNWVAGDKLTVSANGTYQFRVTDAAGNVTESSITVENIDKVAPTMELTASTVEATNSDVELTATVSDGTVEYFNGTEWVVGSEYTVSENGTYQFRVTDAAGNVTESSIEVANIDKVAPEFSIAYNDYLTESPVTLSVSDVVDDSEYTVEYFNGSEWVVGSEYTVSANGTYQFRVTDAAGNATVKEVVVDNIWSADAEIKPEVTPDFESVVVDGKMLHIDESHSEYANSEVQMAAGTTTVNVANGKKDNKSGAIEVTALEIGSISKVDDADGVNNLTAGKYTDVKVNGNIEALGKLSAGNEAEIKVAGTVIGTDANQTVKIGNDSKAVFGDIDLKGGTNNISIGARSEFEAGTVAGVSKLTVANGKQGADAEFVADALVGTAKNNTLTFGNYNDTTVDVKIDLGDGKDTVNFGKNSSSSVGAIANVETIKIGANSGFYADSVTGLNKLTVANGKQVGDGQVYIAEISGTEKNDTLTFGNYNDTSVDVKIDLGDGKDTVNFGKNSSSRVGAIANVETIKIGANSGFHADSVTGLNKLTVANGKQGEEGWGYIAEISGTEKNDTITLGNWNVAWIGSVDFGDGKDTLNLGSNGELYATSLDFGDGKDTLSIGKNSTLSVEEIKNLETLNASKGSVIEFSNGADDVVFDSAMKGSWKNATIMDEAGALVLGENSVNVYSNEYDVFSFTADQNGRLTLDGDDAVTFEYQMAGSDKWLVYNDSIDLAAGDELNIRVAVDFEDKKDKFAKTSASFTAELA